MTEKATILNHIGNTPLLKLNHVTDSLDVDIFVKCEFTNPGDYAISFKLSHAGTEQ